MDLLNVYVWLKYYSKVGLKSYLWQWWIWWHLNKAGAKNELLLCEPASGYSALLTSWLGGMPVLLAHRHLRKIDWLMTCTTCLVCLIISVSGCTRDRSLLIYVCAVHVILWSDLYVVSYEVWERSSLKWFQANILNNSPITLCHHSITTKLFSIKLLSLQNNH